MYIKIHAFDDTKHLPGLGSCREPQVSQEGAEGVAVWTAMCRSAAGWVPSGTTEHAGEGGEFAGFNTPWLSLSRVFLFCMLC